MYRKGQILYCKLELFICIFTGLDKHTSFIYCNAECHYAECHYTECGVLFTIMLNVIMLIVIMLNVIILNVVVPLGTTNSEKICLLSKQSGSIERKSFLSHKMQFFSCNGRLLYLKLFTIIINSVVHKARVFVAVSQSHPSLKFARKALGYGLQREAVVP
jgi:hypothetical protein